ncbi:MAG: hypothetical protein H0Z35_10450 [Thermoanaerobacteraceae bacterium]|nr:hypothetical protein [Thermoanaerobacteraceae bacterium]
MTLTKEQFKYIYALTNKVNPVDFDCGTICAKACCNQPGDLGIYLLPGEEQLIENVSWLTFERHRAYEYDFPPSWRGKQVIFAKCSGACQRHLRPIQCRTFPAAPHIHAGKLYLIRETLELPYHCPLLECTLKREYLHNLHQAWKLLIRAPLIKDLVAWDSRNRMERNVTISVIYRT